MLTLTDCLGRSVADRDGNAIGTVSDLIVRVGGAHPPVTKLELRRHRDRWLLPWDAFASFDQSGARLGCRGDEARAVSLESGELKLRRDVLDVQIVDVASGRRIVRVGEIELLPEGDLLVLAGLDAGAGAILKRLGLGFLARDGRHVVDWSDVHIVSLRGHQTQLQADVGLRRRTTAQLAELIARMPPLRAVDVVHELEPQRAGAAIESLPAEVAAATLRHLDPERREQVLSEIDAERASQMRELLGERAPARRRKRSRFGKILSVRRHAPS